MLHSIFHVHEWALQFGEARRNSASESLSKSFGETLYSIGAFGQLIIHQTSNTVRIFTLQGQSCLVALRGAAALSILIAPCQLSGCACVCCVCVLLLPDEAQRERDKQGEGVGVGVGEGEGARTSAELQRERERVRTRP